MRLFPTDKQIIFQRTDLNAINDLSRHPTMDRLYYIEGDVDSAGVTYKIAYSDLNGQGITTVDIPTVRFRDDRLVGIDVVEIGGTVYLACLFMDNRTNVAAHQRQATLKFYREDMTRPSTLPLTYPSDITLTFINPPVGINNRLAHGLIHIGTGSSLKWYTTLTERTSRGYPINTVHSWNLDGSSGSRIQTENLTSQQFRVRYIGLATIGDRIYVLRRRLSGELDKIIALEFDGTVDATGETELSGSDVRVGIGTFNSKAISVISLTTRTCEIRNYDTGLPVIGDKFFGFTRRIKILFTEEAHLLRHLHTTDTGFLTYDVPEKQIEQFTLQGVQRASFNGALYKDGQPLDESIPRNFVVFDENGVEKIAVLHRDNTFEIYPLPSVDQPHVEPERAIALPNADKDFFRYRTFSISNGNIYAFTQDSGGTHFDNPLLNPTPVVHVVPLDGGTPTSFTISYDDLPPIHSIADFHFFATTDLLFVGLHINNNGVREHFFRAIDLEGNHRTEYDFRVPLDGDLRVISADFQDDVANIAIQDIATANMLLDARIEQFTLAEPDAPTWETIPQQEQTQTLEIEPLDLAEYLEGHPQPTITVLGDLLDGLVFTDGIVTGKFANVGVFTQMFRATNEGGTTDVTVTFNIIAGQAPKAVAKFATIEGNKGNDLFVNLNDVIDDPGTGGYPGITIALKDGEALPDGTTLTGPDARHITGAPTTEGTYATIFVISNPIGSIEATINFDIGPPTVPIFNTYNRGLDGGTKNETFRWVRRQNDEAEVIVSFTFNGDLRAVLSGGRDDVRFEVLSFGNLAGLIESDPEGQLTGHVDVAVERVFDGTVRYVVEDDGNVIRTHHYHDIIVKATNPQGSTTETVRVFTFLEQSYYDEIPNLQREIPPLREIDFVLPEGETQYTIGSLYDSSIDVESLVSSTINNLRSPRDREPTELPYAKDSYVLISDVDDVFDKIASQPEFLALEPTSNLNVYDTLRINIKDGDTHELDVIIFNDFSFAPQRIRVSAFAEVVEPTPATITQLGILGEADVGTPFRLSLSEFIRGNPEPTVTIDNLPGWLTFDEETLDLTGVPVDSGDTNLVVRVSNSLGSDFTNIVIRAAPVSGFWLTYDDGQTEFYSKDYRRRTHADLDLNILLDTNEDEVEWNGGIRLGNEILFLNNTHKYMASYEFGSFERRVDKNFELGDGDWRDASQLSVGSGFVLLDRRTDSIVRFNDEKLRLPASDISLTDIEGLTWASVAADSHRIWVFGHGNYGVSQVADLKDRFRQIGEEHIPTRFYGVAFDYDGNRLEFFDIDVTLDLLLGGHSLIGGITSKVSSLHGLNTLATAFVVEQGILVIEDISYDITSILEKPELLDVSYVEHASSDYNIRVADYDIQISKRFPEIEYGRVVTRAGSPTGVSEIIEPILPFDRNRVIEGRYLNNSLRYRYRLHGEELPDRIFADTFHPFTRHGAFGTYVPPESDAPLQLGQAPEILSRIPTLVGVVGEQFVYDIQFDPGFPSGKFSARLLPDGITLDENTGRFSGIPKFANISIAQITLSNQGHEIILDVLFDITTADTRTETVPTLAKIATQTLTVGEVYSHYVLSAGFPRPTFTASGLPFGVQIDPTTGRIFGDPLREGDFNVVITATNSQGSDTESATFTVKPARGGVFVGVKSPPLIDTIPAQRLESDSLYSYTVTASGAPSPIFSATGLPQGLSINPNTGRVTGTTTDVGGHLVTFTARNDEGVDSISVNFVVTEKTTVVPTIGTDVPVVSGNVVVRRNLSESFKIILTEHVVSGVGPLRFSIDAETPLTDNKETIFQLINPDANGNIVLSGVSTVALDESFNVVVSNQDGSTTFVVRVIYTETQPVDEYPPVFTPIPLIVGYIGQELELDLNKYLTGTEPIEVALSIASAFPPGVELDVSTRIVSGAPLLEGQYESVVNATNVYGVGDGLIEFNFAIRPVATDTEIPIQLPTSDLLYLAKGGFTVTEDRYYFAMSQFGGNGQMAVFDRNGARLVHEEFPLPHIARSAGGGLEDIEETGYVGLEFINGNFYLLADRYVPISLDEKLNVEEFYRGVIYVLDRQGQYLTEMNVLRNGYPLPDTQGIDTSKSIVHPLTGFPNGLAYNPITQRFIVSHGAKVATISDETVVTADQIGVYIYDSDGKIAKFTSRFYTNPSNRISPENVYDIAYSGENRYYNIEGKIYSGSFSRESDDDIVRDTRNIDPYCVGYSENQVHIYDNAVSTVFIYGDRIPITQIPQVSVQQFFGLDEWVQRFDVLDVDAVTRLHEDVEMLVRADTDFQVVSAELFLEETRESFEFIPRFTIPGIRQGQIIVPHTQLGRAVSEESYVIMDTQTVSDLRRQKIFAGRSTI